MNIILISLFPLVVSCFNFNETCQSSRSNNPPDCLALNYPGVEEVQIGLKVAFMADQSLNSHAYDVISMLKNQGVDAVFHPGDLDYINDPIGWGDFINDTLGESFPYFVSYGNHEAQKWEGQEGYQGVIYNRLKRNNESCIGTVGLAMICSFRGLSVALLGPASTPLNGGFTGDDLIQFVEGAFTQFGTRWRFCLFHFNQNDYQLGNKPNDVGFGLFEACRNMGAIIVNGHSHSYSRTYLMSDFENHTIVNTSSNLTINEGEVFLVVSAVAGQSPRVCNPDRGGYQNFPWWGSALCADSDPPLKQGALILTFTSLTTADAEFREFTNEVRDQFTINTNLSLSSECQPTQGATCQNLGACNITIDTGCGDILCECSIGENCIDNLCECDETLCTIAGRVCSNVGCVFKNDTTGNDNIGIILAGVFGGITPVFIVIIILGIRSMVRVKSNSLYYNKKK